MSKKKWHDVQHEEDRRKVWLGVVTAAHNNPRLNPLTQADGVLEAFDKTFKAEDLRADGEE